MDFNKIQVRKERKTSKIKEIWEQKGPSSSDVLSEIHHYSTANIYVEDFLHTDNILIFLMQWTYLRPKHI